MAGTTTRSFGSADRVGHDASAFYSRKMTTAAAAVDSSELGEPQAPPAELLDQIFCASSTSMHHIPDNCVALMVTSPPYNCGKDYDEDLDLDEFMAMLEAVLTETYRVLQPGGRLAINVANLGRKPYIPLNHYVAGLLVDIGFQLRGEIIWQKAKGAGGSTAWGTWQSARNPVLRDIHEYILVASKGPFSRLVAGDDTIRADDFMASTLSVWPIRPESAKRVGHPAPFPIELPQRLIELYTFADELVLDPFIGSGTTAIAARLSGRHYVGYDTNPDYVALVHERLENAPIGGRSSKRTALQSQ